MSEPIEHHPSIIELATPTILLVPIQPISQESFTRIVQLIRQFSTFPLSEVIPPHQSQSHSPPSSPLLDTPQQNHHHHHHHQLIQPHLLLNFNASYFFSPSAIHHKFLHTFQPHRKPFGIIGIVDCAHWGPSSDQRQLNYHQPSKPHPISGTLNDALRSFELLLATHHPRTPVGRCFGFHPTDYQKDDVEGLVLIPHVGDPKFYLQRLITEFASDLLRSFQHLSAVLQSTSSLETPRQSYNSALFDSIPILPPLHMSPNPVLPTPSDLAPAGATITTTSSKLTAPKARQPMDYMLTDLKPSSEPPSPGDLRPEEPGHSTSVPPAINHRLQKTESRTASSFSPPPIDSRVRKKHIGRIRKVEADLELLAANPINALKIYNEAIGHLKSASDHVWWAAALEGLAVAKMLALLAGVAIENSVQEILDDLELAVETYYKALSRKFDGTLMDGNPESVEPLVFVESVLRLLDFKLEFIQLRDSQVERADGDMLRILLGNHLARRRKPSHLEPSSVAVRLDMNRIGSMVELAVDGLRFSEDRIRALGKLVGVFEAIGFTRKAAWFKRELVGVVVEQIGKFRGSVPLHGRQELVKLMEEVCSSFRVPIDELDQHPVVMDYYRSGGIQQALPGWKELQLGALMDAVITSHHLEEHVTELKFRLKLNEFLDHRGPHDLEIKDDDRRINWLFKSLAKPSLKYWGPRQIILTLELVPLSNRHALIPYHKRPPLQTGSQNVNSGTAAILPLPTFYYNHNRAPMGIGKEKALPLKMVRDEPIHVLVTLQNPMSIDLDVLMICLSTSGVEFEAVRTQTVIKSRRVKTIALTGVPLASGTLKIKGCHVQLMGCQAPHEFILPVGKPRWKKSEDDQLLTVHVVDSLPFLRILSGCDELVAGGGVMVYNGEVITIEIKMMNTSGVRADWIDVAVQDSLSEQMKKGLEELQGGSRQLTAYERYQLEYELVARPVVRVRWSESIGAHGVGWVRLTCLGKAGCRWVGVRIEYDVDGGANLKRQLEWRMDLSVQKSLALVGLETLPGGVLIIKVRNSAQGGQVFEVHAKGGKPEPQTVFKNSQKQVMQPGSTHAFFIEIPRIKVSQLDAEKSIPALIDRQFVVGQHGQNSSHRNPDKQRAADAGAAHTHHSDTMRPAHRKMAHAELVQFWIKDRLLNTVKMEWREVGTCKTGEISLRGIHIDQQMIANLRSHEVAVQVHILNDDDDDDDDGRDYSKAGPQDALGRTSCFVPRPQAFLQTDRFYSVSIKLKNQSGMKRKVDCVVKVMGLDGAVIIPSPSSTRGRTSEHPDESGSLVYLVEGLVKEHQDGATGPSDHHRHGGYAGKRTVMLAADDDDDDDDDDDGDGNDEDESGGRQHVQIQICFLTRGAFLIQALALDSSLSPRHTHQHDDGPGSSSLGASDLVHVVVS
ncbi:hypothetical protein PCANC_25034 [Puccinia coronata f. sp. avenae]|uniref:Uncharacterized protein n=1 Tax=Puccinia coronata f. sp. avenae TaxID=200324 RepID=A0A2N5S608_9BASI|nr:hypothetical protein PCANC_25034 [Puccinia coronata f. sp. avenae]